MGLGWENPGLSHHREGCICAGDKVGRSRVSGEVGPDHHNDEDRLIPQNVVVDKVKL